MFRGRTAELPKEPVAPNACPHYWVIESANGPTSHGICKICGEKREFRNSWYEFVAAKKHGADSPEIAKAVDEAEEDESKELVAEGAAVHSRKSARNN